MLHHLDPHTTFYTPEELQHAQSDVSGEFKGVGIQIRQDPETDQLLVISPIYNSPAFKAGIQAGDLITAITPLVDDDGKKLESLRSHPDQGTSDRRCPKADPGQEGHTDPPDRAVRKVRTSRSISMWSAIRSSRNASSATSARTTAIGTTGSIRKVRSLMSAFRNSRPTRRTIWPRRWPSWRRTASRG